MTFSMGTVPLNGHSASQWDDLCPWPACHALTQHHWPLFFSASGIQVYFEHDSAAILLPLVTALLQCAAALSWLCSSGPKLMV